ncbi:hypothetical protein [Pragia fontium]|uniref:hypothetical protein n=1 Tax=Pragia fontium TaxID=82985 RepID=UPI000F6E09E2|nr:hypothetical protein [Pragia fontium]VEJ53233.1 Protein of uncharacterised function (DUF3298) [Pragia fontium]
MFMRLFKLIPLAGAIWLLGIWPAQAEYDVSQTYTGQIGTLPIVAEFSVAESGEVTGRYFYHRYRKDIALTGSQLGDGGFKLYENKSIESNKNGPWIKLMPTTEKGFTGQWNDAKGKTLKVTLTIAAVPQENNGNHETPYLQTLIKENLYDYLRLHNAPLNMENEQQFMGYGFRWLKEPVSGIRMFELTSGYPQDVMIRVNLQLKERLWREVVDYHSCMFGGLLSSAGQADFTQTVKPTYFSSSVISASVFTEFYCGGAHPDFADSPINMDVKTGNQLALEDVLWLGKGEPVYYNQQGNDDTGFEEFSAYRSHVFAPWLVAKLKALYPKQMKASDECDYSTVEYWEFVNWHFTEKGLYFSPSFPRVARSCEYPTWSILPYRDIKAHAGHFKTQ